MDSRIHKMAQAALPRRTVEACLRVHAGVYNSAEFLGSEHPRLLDVLREGDPERGERATPEHVERAAARVVDFLKTTGPPPAGE